MKKFTPIMLTLSLLINVALGVLLYMGTGTLGPEAEENLAEIRASGVYGPEGMKVVDGDATISAAGVVLQNTLVTGNLVLTEDIGAGSLELKNVIVKGSTLVNGGGEATIILEDTSLEEMVVNQPQSRVRIVAKGATSVKNVILQTGALLEEGVLHENAAGFLKVEVHTEDEIDLVGDFAEVFLKSKARLLVRLGKVDMLLVEREGKESYIEFFEGAGAGRMELLAEVEIAGVGNLEETEIRGVGLTKLAGKFGTVLTGGRAIFIEFSGGRVEALTVEESEGMVSIHVPEPVVVAGMELNGMASVTGQGTIETVIINTDGTTIEQTPGKVELAKGITAMVGGKELPEIAPVPEPKPSTPPAPATPRVSISSINNIANLYVGDTATRNITINPSDANISVKSSSTGVATVSVTGNTVTVTAVKAGSATISVTGKKAGYNDRTVTFTVSVVGPTTVKSFSTEAGLSPGKTLVYVEIWAKDPQNYTVRCKGVTLKYLASHKYFYGEVNTDDAKRGNVSVSK